MAKKKASSKAKGGVDADEFAALAALLPPSPRQIVLDTETTGLMAANGDRLVEIGCVEIVDGKVTGRIFHTFINPQRDIPDDAIAVHGLTAAFLRDKPTFEKVYRDFLEFVKHAEIIIHNASFDVGFLNMELEKVGGPQITDVVAKVTDTLAVAKQVWTSKKNSLDALCDRLGVDNSGRTQHGALLDAQLLAEVFLAMGRGQPGLSLDGGATVEQLRTTTSSDGSLDFSTLALPVLKASDAEQEAHEAYLTGMEKEGKKMSIWRKAERGLTGDYLPDGTPVTPPAPPPPPPPAPPPTGDEEVALSVSAPSFSF